MLLNATLRFFNIAVPWLIILFTFFVTVVIQIEAVGYHLIHPLAFTVTYTAIAGLLTLLWLTTWFTHMPLSLTASSLEERMLIRIHQKTNQYHVNVGGAILTTLLSLSITQVLLWVWVDRYVIRTDPDASVDVDSPTAASEQWFRYTSVITLLHYLTLIRLCYAMVQRHVLMFYDEHTLGLLRRRDVNTSSVYEIRALHKNELQTLGVSQNASVFLSGEEQRRVNDSFLQLLREQFSNNSSNAEVRYRKPLLSATAYERF